MSKPTDEFMRHIADATDMLEVIKQYTENFFETFPEEVNYGHVGSAGKLCEDLREIMAFLGITKETYKKEG